MRNNDISGNSRCTFNVHEKLDIWDTMKHPGTTRWSFYIAGKYLFIYLKSKESVISYLLLGMAMRLGLYLSNTDMFILNTEYKQKYLYLKYRYLYQNTDISI